jgi:hypothetical protein
MPKTRDQRRSPQYDLHLAVRFAVHRPHGEFFGGAGTTVNISSSGMVICPDTLLRRDDSVTLAADWPLSPSEGEPTFLVISGSVVWTRAALAALSITRYRFMPQREFQTVAQTLTTDEVQSKKRHEPLLPYVVLVDDHSKTWSLFSALLRPRGFLVEFVNTSNARRIMKTGFPPVSLLVTSSQNLWSQSARDIPSILILDPGESAPPNDLVCPVILRKPLTVAAIQNAVDRFSEEHLVKHADSA